MIDGLKVTMSGEEVRELMAQRIAEHYLRSARWTEEAARTPADATEDAPLLPEHICENEAARSQWRAERLTFVRDRIVASETYLLGEMDLDFGEFLAEPPTERGPEDLEELGPDAKGICDSPEIIEIRNPDYAG